MAFYPFVPEPPVPRTKFREEGPVRPVGQDGSGAPGFEQAVVNVLTRYPEAYHAVLEEMRRLDEERRLL